MTTEEYESQKPPLNVTDSPEFVQQMARVNADDNARHPVYSPDELGR